MQDKLTFGEFDGFARSGFGFAVAPQRAVHLNEQTLRLHGGNMRVASQGPGLGATFTVSLPLQAIRHEPEAEAEAQCNAAVDKAAIGVNLGGSRCW